MSVAFWLLAATVTVNGLLAGSSFDVAAVKLPTLKRIGAVAYVNFARGNDLGNGLVIYPAAGILAALLVFGTTITTYIAGQSPAVMVPLLLACVGTIAHSLCTAKAAPIMLGLRGTPDEEGVLAAKLDQFAFWHGLRTVFQISTFVVVLWALVEAARQL
ncbi:MAG TPA: hypothetical protein VHJ99_10805 [Candidatus Dormibacteraeota bacterium]|nr:hypothetical protein [Candidatus Dormibacteraeota bacterium]